MTTDNLVFVEQLKNDLSEEVIQESMDFLLDGLRKQIYPPSGAIVVVKINLCLLLGPETGATVDPIIAKSIVFWLNRNFDIGQIYLAEADATHLNADLAFQILGWKDFDWGFSNVELLNLSNDEKIVSPIAKHLCFSKIMMESDLLISLAKLKTHVSQKITCVMKNQFGAISEKYKVRYHPILAQAICDAVLSRKPELCIVDGLIAMEGNGPTNGIPKKANLLISGNDPFCIDHYCAKVMGFRPSTVPNLSLWKKNRYGNIDYKVKTRAPIPKKRKFKYLPLWKQLLKGTIDKFSRNE